MTNKADLHGNVKPRATLGSEVRPRDDSSNAVKTRAILRIAPQSSEDSRDSLKNGWRSRAVDRAADIGHPRSTGLLDVFSGNPLRPVFADSAGSSEGAGGYRKT